MAATASAACDAAVLPGPVTNLSSTPAKEGGAAEICWGAPLGRACVDEYRLAVRAADQSSGPTRFQRASSAGCVTISKLQNGVTHEVFVQSYSAALKGGPSARVTARPVAPPAAWRCLPAPGAYPLCSTAVAGRCTPMTCAQQVGRQLTEEQRSASEVAPCRPRTLLPLPTRPCILRRCCQAAVGACDAPFMRIIDAAQRVLVQHCSDVCG